ncbi:three-Cys-motif partner protein TcmP [Amycolatopsis albispora]|uniref:three-Cys-motif partner protein TcmP n=1 Tax=Amycolatopsis albispora TaxID=1804986 RepID=UPI0013B359A4|nr:three-Cys-motif partner protein TcmP [Amycolatopsis albispora]
MDDLSGGEMSKDSAPEKWGYPPHTKAKHDILAYYLDGWYPTLSRWNGRILFLDGFAGRGRYTNKAEGSPLIALKHLLDHQYYPHMTHREFVFLFIEADADNVASLQAEIDKLKAQRAPWPDKIKVHVEHAAFDESATSLIDYLKQQKKSLAPTFAFVDPFGYSGLPMDTLASLLSYDKTEIFVNFMVNHVNRFITREGQESAMRSLFGMDVGDILSDFNGENRIEHLKDVYERQLKKLAGFDHVQSFAMKNSTGNVGYYMIHGTRHIKGVKLMKDAMWKIDPGGGYTFSDKLAGVSVLFEANPDLKPLRANLVHTFTGAGEVTIEEIEQHTILYTPYRDAHVRSVLNPLENEGLISVRRLGKKGYAKGKTWITFT